MLHTVFQIFNFLTLTTIFTLILATFFPVISLFQHVAKCLIAWLFFSQPHVVPDCPTGLAAARTLLKQITVRIIKQTWFWAIHLASCNSYIHAYFSGLWDVRGLRTSPQNRRCRLNSVCLETILGDMRASSIGESSSRSLVGIVGNVIWWLTKADKTVSLFLLVWFRWERHSSVGLRL